jgi:hypothetical protein
MRPLEYYTYSTPVIRIVWNGRVQPIGYKSAIEAKQAIEAIVPKFGRYQIQVPTMEGMILLSVN